MKKLILVATFVALIVSCRTTSNSSLVKDDETDSNTRNITKVTCRDDSGDRMLTIERSINELPFPTYHIMLAYRGQVFTNVSDAPVARNTQSSFMVQKIATVDDREGIEVSAGVNWQEGNAKGFYMEAANEGMSPMPGLTLNNCQISEVGGIPTTNQQNIEKLTCRDNSGDRVLIIERSINELPFPTYHVKLQFRGTIFTNVGDAPVKRNTAQSFMVQKVDTVDDREDIEVSAGANWTDSGVRGFYMEAANGGASPLPGADFANCEVKYAR